MPSLSDYWNKFQVSLFPRLESVLEEPITEKLKRFIRPAVLRGGGYREICRKPIRSMDGTQTS